jgi:N-hydroxyarylamine O-acetyltransferase
VTVDIEAYLSRLGLSAVGPPSVADLRRLHAAHVERVPFETLPRTGGLDLGDAFAAIVRDGRGGTCFHLNGCFRLLLEALGYDVQMHPAGVQSVFAAKPVGADGSHLMLTVAGLPSAENPEGRWVADVGTGEGFHEPLPLRPGNYRSGAFTYRVRPSQTGPDCWRLDYDERESCRGVDFADKPADRDQYAELYRRQAEGEWSLFGRYGWVKRHHARGYDELLGCLSSSVDAHGRRSVELNTSQEYFGVLRDTFGLTLSGLTAEQRTALWDQTYAAWTGAGAPAAGAERSAP